MKSIRIRNIRSLADTGAIDLKPITLFLGQNSSGKSSALRMLPLIKQSIETRSNAPILWFGDYVDFGSVHEVLSTFAKDQGVHIEVDFGKIPLLRRRAYEPNTSSRLSIDIRLSLELVEIENKTRLRSFTIISGPDKLVFRLDLHGNASSITVNEKDYTSFFPHERFRIFALGLIPELLIRSPTQAEKGSFYDTPSREVDTVFNEIRKMLSERMHGGISAGTITQLARRIQYRTGSDFIAHVKSIHSPLRSWTLFVASLTQESQRHAVERLRGLAMLLALPDLLYTLEVKIGSVAATISYLGPSRATGERYYRMQELAVNEIDPQGKNLPMFLHSLPQFQFNAFSKWLEQALGYAIRISRSAGHIQIELRDLSSDIYYNMADMGYGFSQILPIMAQIWSREYQNSALSHEPIVAIEQPELHLHPAYQAKFADVLARSIQDRADNQGRRSRRKARFVIETHSEAVVNRIGELIIEGSISHEDVAIYIFEKQPSDRSTTIRKVSFEEDGTLQNWPIGFFSSKSL